MFMNCLQVSDPKKSLNVRFYFVVINICLDCKLRRLVVEKKEVYRAKDVFRDFKDDNYETIMQCFAYDFKLLKLNEFT